jgi:hypothetical protein
VSRYSHVSAMKPEGLPIETTCEAADVSELEDAYLINQIMDPLGPRRHLRRRPGDRGTASPGLLRQPPHAPRAPDAGSRHRGDH